MSKSHPLKPDEVRVIKLGRDAILELIMEGIIEYANFGLPDCAEDKAFSLRCDAAGSIAFFAYRQGLDFDAIARETGITANSIFDAVPYIIRHAYLLMDAA